MTVPLVVLAVFAVGAGWSGIPENFPGLGGILPNWFEKFTGSMLGEVGARGCVQCDSPACFSCGFTGRAWIGMAGLSIS